VGRLQYPLTGVAASFNGKLIAAGDLNGGITVWEIGSNESKELWKTRNYTLGSLPKLDTPGSPHSLSFSPDGKSIFSGLHTGTIRSLDTNSGAEVQRNQSLDAHVTRMVISHNSQYLVTQHEDDLITVWDLWSGSILYQRQGEIKDGDPFSQNDRLLAIASDPETVKVYDPANGQETYTFNGDRNPRAIKFIKENAQLVAVYDGAMRLWSMTSKEELKTTLRYEGTGCSTIYDVNEDPVVSITKYYYVIEDQQNRRGLCQFDPLDWVIAINEVQGMIAFGGSSKLTVIRMQGVGSGTQEMLGVNRKDVVRVALSPDGALLAAAYDDHTIHIWDIARREELSNFYGHNNSIIHLRFTPDGKLLISSSLDGTIRLWGVPY
jgi:WD40 repeat protein